MESERIQHFYHQSLNWTEHRLQRYLLVGRCKDDAQFVLALTLALLSHRLPFYGQTLAAMEDPDQLAEQVVKVCKLVSDSDKKLAVGILCSMAQRYADTLEHDGEQSELLAITCAEICISFEEKGMPLVAAVQMLASLVKHDVSMEHVKALAAKGKRRESRASLSDGIQNFKLGKFAEAESQLLLALASLERNLPEDSKEVLHCMEKLGDTFYASEKFNEAQLIYRRLFVIRERGDGSKVLSTAALFKLAKTHERLGQFDEAEAIYERAETVGEEMAGPMYASLLYAHAAMLRRSGRSLKKAFELERRAKRRHEQG